MSEWKIREVREEDAGELARIYSWYVLNTAVSFEYEVPTVSEFRKRIAKTTAKYPYLVCEKDGVIAGYAYAGEYSSREAYAWTVTVSVYVDRDCRRQGIGSKLYAELERRLKEKGIVNILAGAAYREEEDEYLTHDSYLYHTRMGYTKAAHLKGIGKKFGRWYDLLWMQKKIQ